MSKQIVHKEIKKLVQEIEALGFTVSRDNGKYQKVFTADGNYVYSLPTTPGRGRWKKNLVSELRKRGLAVRAT